MARTGEGGEEDLFGFDQFQENTRVLGLLIVLSEKIVQWNQEVQQLSVRASTEHLGFYDLNLVVRHVVSDVNDLLNQIAKEKKKFHEECKKVRNSIKTEPLPYTNPEPDQPKETVLQEGVSRPKKRKSESSKSDRRKKPLLRLKTHRTHTDRRARRFIGTVFERTSSISMRGLWKILVEFLQLLLQTLRRSRCQEPPIYRCDDKKKKDKL